MLDLVLALGLITAWLYTVGWSYASHYFGYFHVGLLALEVPAESFLIYGFWVLRNHLALFIVLSLLAVGLAVARGSIGRVPAGGEARARRRAAYCGPRGLLGRVWARGGDLPHSVSQRPRGGLSRPSARAGVGRPGLGQRGPARAPRRPARPRLPPAASPEPRDGVPVPLARAGLAGRPPAGPGAASAAVQAMRVLPRYESCRPDAATPR